MQYAYSLLECKDFHDDSDFVTVKGIASTPTPDRSNDIVDPMGAKFQTPMPLLWMHQSDKPVGNVSFAKPTNKGIPFEAEIPKVTEVGNLKDRIDEVIQSLKYKLVAAVSIGFRPIEDDYEFMDNGGIRFNSWEWLELSLVTIPANPEARIEVVKSINHQALAALGIKADDRSSLFPGDTGKQYRRPIQLIPRKEK